MTTTQKVVMAAMAAALVAANVYQATRVSALRGQVQTLQDQQQPMTQQIQSLQQERDDAARRLETAQLDNLQLRQSTADVSQLRDQVARLQGDSRELAALKTAPMNNPTESAARYWLARVDLLRQRLEQTPEAKIPELKFVTEQDWLNATRDKLETDEDYRRALSALRNAGESKFVDMLVPALSKYMKASNNQFPTDMSQLQSYFESPVDDAVLQRYEIVPAGTLRNLRLGGDWVITQKAPVDEDFDTRWGIGPGSFGTSGSGAWKPDPVEKQNPATRP